MKKTFILATLPFILFCCNTKDELKTAAPTAKPIEGTWRLLRGTLIEDGITTVTDYTKGNSFIKIINQTHFAFLQHDENKPKDSASAFTAGGGRYSLKESVYTEHLEYCSAREWEGHDFPFTITLKGDTLTQSGVEKVEGTNINRQNTEVYVRQR